MKKIDKIRDTLMKKHRELCQESNSILNNLREIPKATGGHEVENVGHEDVPRKRLKIISKQMEDISKALVRISEGKFGKCEDCGENIAEKRLLAMPSAKRCVDCQAAKEDAQK